MGAVNIRSPDRASIDAAFLNCARRELAIHDESLKFFFQKGLGDLDEGGKKRLQEIQGAWVKLRDDNCTFLARGLTQDARASERMRCTMEWTAGRAKELELAFYTG